MLGSFWAAAPEITPAAVKKEGARRAMKNFHLSILLIAMLASPLMGCATMDIVGGPIPEDTLIDGTYEGTATEGPVKVVARVTIDERRIARIELLEHRTWKGGAAEKSVPARIMAEQSTRVDAVSGATMSSRAIMKAVEVAIRQAQQN